MKRKKILHVMLCSKLGGMEMSFLNYNKALNDLGYQVYNIVPRGSEIISYLEKTNSHYIEIRGCKHRKIFWSGGEYLG